MKPLVLAVVGPTASGKSEIALDTAERANGEIVSVDSMQLYRGMDVGTAKLPVSARRGITHHMIDVAEPDATYSVSAFQSAALRSMDEIILRGRIPILAGGSGLHFNSLTFDLAFGNAQPDAAFRQSIASCTDEELYEQLLSLDAAAAGRIHPHNRPRVIRALEIARGGAGDSYDFRRPSNKYEFRIAGLAPERPRLYDLINMRVERMLQAGLIAEVDALQQRFPGSRVLASAIGYKELQDYFKGNTSLENSINNIQKGTRHLAKRQMTWFKRDLRIHWFDPWATEHAGEEIVDWLASEADRRNKK